MTKRWSLFLVSLAVAAFVGSPLAVADMYDDFGDGTYAGGSSDPNDWRLDNPNWMVLNLVGLYFDDNIGSDDVADTAFRMAVTGYPAGTPLPGPFGAIGATPADVIPDPNLSRAFKDDSQNHYVLCWMYYTNHPEDPCDDVGNIGPMIHTGTSSTTTDSTWGSI